MPISIRIPKLKQQLLGPDGQSGWEPSCREMEHLLTGVGFCDVCRDSLAQERTPPPGG